MDRFYTLIELICEFGLAHVLTRTTEERLLSLGYTCARRNVALLASTEEASASYVLVVRNSRNLQLGCWDGPFLKSFIWTGD
jgi:hypothetical protein